MARIRRIPTVNIPPKQPHTVTTEFVARTELGLLFPDHFFLYKAYLFCLTFCLVWGRMGKHAILVSLDKHIILVRTALESVRFGRGCSWCSMPDLEHLIFFHSQLQFLLCNGAGGGG
jgi:hypothetical protein